MLNGGGSQTRALLTGPITRWGDYSAMTIDPADDCTFWYTNGTTRTVALIGAHALALKGFRVAHNAIFSVRLTHGKQMAYIELRLIGLLVGTLVGLTGVGGGVLMTPILIIVMGMPPSIAIGTDLFYAAITKMVGATQHWNLKTVDLGIVASLAAGSIPGQGGQRVRWCRSRDQVEGNSCCRADYLVALVMLLRIFLGRFSFGENERSRCPSRASES